MLLILLDIFLCASMFVLFVLRGANLLILLGSFVLEGGRSRSFKKSQYNQAVTLGAHNLYYVKFLSSCIRMQATVQASGA